MFAQKTLSSDVVEVYLQNFFQELEKIQKLIHDYPYVAMDTEFPGDVYDLETSQYNMVAHNVNQLKLIQLGITLANEKGEYPEPQCTWQFNFKFNVAKDEYNASSIELLKQSGINF